MKKTEPTLDRLAAELKRLRGKNPPAYVAMKTGIDTRKIEEMERGIIDVNDKALWALIEFYQPTQG